MHDHHKTRQHEVSENYVKRQKKLKWIASVPARYFKTIFFTKKVFTLVKE